MAQLNPLVGDIAGNQALIREAIIKARDEYHADVIVFSELMISGYPPEDLLHYSSFITACETAVDELQAECNGITAIIGCPRVIKGKRFNAAVVLRAGCPAEMALKQSLPNYDVFDEQRYFEAGSETLVVQLASLKAGITICEDIWTPQAALLAGKCGADFIINLNASPFYDGKHEARMHVLEDRINETGLPIVYVNQVGGQDELIFDGGSMIVDTHKNIVVQAPVYEDGLYVARIYHENEEIRFGGEKSVLPDGEALTYKALVYAVRDYVNKNGFSGAVIGLSGGIDSALTLAIAVDALGAERVSAIMMPYKYTSDMSLEDAQTEAKVLGVDYHVIPIDDAFNAFGRMLHNIFNGTGHDVTEENLQARSRGVVLMAVSNKFRKIVLSTGNKSELAVGYATLYGDMVGGFSPLKDVYKTLVYRLARYRNQVSHVIPQRVIDRAPSAELAPGQLDQDSLPDYQILDQILDCYIEKQQSINSIVNLGFEDAIVQDVINRVDTSEYKRRQASPGVKITSKSFGKDRRNPITCRISR